MTIKDSNPIEERSYQEPAFIIDLIKRSIERSNCFYSTTTLHEHGIYQPYIPNGIVFRSPWDKVAVILAHMGKGKIIPSALFTDTNVSGIHTTPALQEGSVLSITQYGGDRFADAPDVVIVETRWKEAIEKRYGSGLITCDMYHWLSFEKVPGMCTYVLPTEGYDDKELQYAANTQLSDLFVHRQDVFLSEPLPS